VPVNLEEMSVDHWKNLLALLSESTNQVPPIPWFSQRRRRWSFKRNKNGNFWVKPLGFFSGRSLGYPLGFEWEYHAQMLHGAGFFFQHLP